VQALCGDRRPKVHFGDADDLFLKVVALGVEIGVFFGHLLPRLVLGRDCLFERHFGVAPVPRKRDDAMPIEGLSGCAVAQARLSWKRQRRGVHCRCEIEGSKRWG
jgi:hypothetical protein